MGLEIERKFIIDKLPFDLSSYDYHEIEQGYLTRNPVVRIRKEDDTYYLTYKSKGRLIKEEYNLPLTKEAYEELLPKISGNLIKKIRYLIPYNQELTIEFDVFKGMFKGLMLAEVEFSSEKEANSFVPPEWFGRDVTYTGEYQNSKLSLMNEFTIN